MRVYKKTHTKEILEIEKNVIFGYLWNCTRITHNYHSPSPHNVSAVGNINRNRIRNGNGGGGGGDDGIETNVHTN